MRRDVLLFCFISFLLCVVVVDARQKVEHLPCYRLQNASVAVDIYYDPNSKFAQIALYGDLLQSGWLAIGTDPQQLFVIDSSSTSLLQYSMNTSQHVQYKNTLESTSVRIKEDMNYMVSIVYVPLELLSEGHDIILMRSRFSKWDNSSSSLHSADYMLFDTINLKINNNGAECRNLKGYYERVYKFSRMEDLLNLCMRWTILPFVGPLLLVTLIWLRNEKYIKARSFLPYSCLLSMIVTELIYCLITVLGFFLSPDQHTKAHAILLFVSAMTSFHGNCLYSLQQIRYFYFRILRSIVMRRGKTVISTTFHRRVTSRVALVILASVINIVYAGAYASVLVVVTDRVKCIKIFMLMPSHVLITLVGALGFMIDFVVEIKTIWRRGLRFYFFTDDPLYFRPEAVCAIIACLVSTAYLPLFMYFLTIYPRTEEHYAARTIAVATASLGMLFIKLLMFLCVGNGFTILLITAQRIYGVIPATIKKEKKKKKKEDKDYMDQFLSSEKGLDMMKQWCEKEQSLENIELWIVLQKLKQKNRFTIGEVKRIEDLFIKSDSDKEINIKDEQRDAFHKLIGDAEKNSINELCFSDLAPIENAAKLNMVNTMLRLKKTDEYQAFSENLSFCQELLKNEFRLKI